MQLTQIQGDSYYIRGGTNTGIYLLDEASALIIDAGLSIARGKKIGAFLQEQNIKMDYCIATHEHLDHYEAYAGIRALSGNCLFCCPKESAPFLEVPKLFYTYIYGGNPHQKLLGKTRPEVFDFEIHQRLCEGETEWSNGRVRILDLRGHSHGMAAVLTEDRVLYLGDALFDYNIMKKYELPFIFDVENFLNSLTKIRQTDFDWALIAHSKGAYRKEEIDRLSEKNAENVYKYLNQLREFLKQPSTREELLAAIIQKNSFEFSYKEYHYYYSTIGSMLSYLHDRDQIDFILQDGRLCYYNK